MIFRIQQDEKLSGIELKSILCNLVNPVYFFVWLRGRACFDLEDECLIT